MNFFQKLKSLFIADNTAFSGKWTGSYRFGKAYPEIMRSKKVHFTAFIADGADGNFTGVIKESDEGIPEDAKIEGQIRGKKIKFTKTYERSYQVDETGLRTSKDGPMHIQYEGVFDQSGSRIIGQWRIRRVYKVVQDYHLEHESIGYWDLEKE